MYLLNILNMLHILRFFPLRDAFYFIMLSFLVPVIFTFKIQGVLKLRKKIRGQRVNYDVQTGYLFFVVGFFILKAKIYRILNS